MRYSTWSPLFNPDGIFSSISFILQFFFLFPFTRIVCLGEGGIVSKHFQFMTNQFEGFYYVRQLFMQFLI